MLIASTSQVWVALSADEGERRGAYDSWDKCQHVAWPRPCTCSCARCSTRSRFLVRPAAAGGRARKVWAGAARNCAQTTEQKERTAQRGVAGAMRATGASAGEGAGEQAGADGARALLIWRGLETRAKCSQIDSNLF